MPTATLTSTLTPTATLTPTPTPTATPNPVLAILADYHPKLREAVIHPAPETAGDKAFLADGLLSDSELRALERAQSVFGLPAFYDAWELDTLKVNEVQAVLYMLTFYDPYTVVNDITADPDDPDAEGARMTRALDEFGVFPGSCVYCKGQRYFESRAPAPSHRDEWAHYGNATGLRHGPQGAEYPVFQRTLLLNLVHHTTVQADMLSPCDLNDFSVEELRALGAMTLDAGRLAYGGGLARVGGLAYGGGMLSFTHSVRLTDEMLESASEGAAAHGVYDMWIADAPGVLVQPGEVLSPFTHAVRAIGGPPTSRGREQCLEAVEGIVDWDRKRYYHFLYGWYETMVTYVEHIFPENPLIPPVWATFLVYESGGQDKGERLAAQFRALNMPAAKDIDGVHLNENAERAIMAKGRWGVFLPAFSLYLHRNIGFGISELDTEDLIQEHKIPDHCELRRGEGSFHLGSVRVEYVCSKTPRSLTDPPDGTFTAISVGRRHACALGEDGVAVCWGGDSVGESSPPVGETFAAVSAGEDHTCALREDGTPVCWGSDTEGQSSPPAGERFTDISAGVSYTCALREDGTPACWGWDIFRWSSREEREQFLSSSFTDIDAGEIHTVCGVLTDGGVMCGPGYRYHLPQDMEFVSISAGRNGVCALRGDGTPLCWGSDFHETPPAGEKFTEISTGANGACGLREGGTAACWGAGFTGPLPMAGQKFAAISLGSDSIWNTIVCALREDGAADCWRMP